MDISQMLDFVIRGIGPVALGGYGVYQTEKRIKKRIKERNENEIKESGLLEVSRMELDEVDMVRAIRVIKLSEAPRDIDAIEMPGLKSCAEALEDMGKAYSDFVKECELQLEYELDLKEARNNFYRSLGVRIYINKRYIGNKRFGDDIFTVSKFNSL